MTTKIIFSTWEKLQLPMVICGPELWIHPQMPTETLRLVLPVQSTKQTGVHNVQPNALACSFPEWVQQKVTTNLRECETENATKLKMVVGPTN